MQKLKITLSVESELENVNIAEAISVLSDFGDVKVVNVEVVEQMENSLDGTRG